MKIKLGEEELAVKVLNRHVTEIDGGRTTSWVFTV